MVAISIQYFAILREQRGVNREELTTPSQTAVELYEELKKKYSFSLKTNLLKVAINDEFCAWSTVLKPGDRVAFIPPVAGG